MNDQNNMAQLRYLEELKISLVHAGFEPERIEDQHLPVRWEHHYLCRVSGKGSVLYRQENVDGIGAQDALQTVIHIAAMTAEYMTAMERAPKLQATGLEGDYRILGYVGAGGLGLIMNEKIGWREYDSLGMILIVLFVTVMVIEGISHALRKRLT